MPKQVRLRAPVGTDEANHGTERFRVGNDGTIEVPAEMATSFEGVGGFSEVKDPVDLPAEKVRLAHDDADASCGFRGESFAAGADGTFIVPAHAVAELIAHGFKAIEA